MSKIVKSHQLKSKIEIPNGNKSRVDSTYFQNSKSVKTKRISVSPDYQNAYKNLMQSVWSTSSNNVPYFTTKRKPSHENLIAKRTAKRRSLNVINQSVRNRLDPVSISLHNDSPARVWKKTISKPKPSTKKCSQKVSFVKKAPMTKSFK